MAPQLKNPSVDHLHMCFYHFPLETFVKNGRPWLPIETSIYKLVPVIVQWENPGANDFLWFSNKNINVQMIFDDFQLKSFYKLFSWFSI